MVLIRTRRARVRGAPDDHGSKRNCAELFGANVSAIYFPCAEFSEAVGTRSNGNSRSVADPALNFCAKRRGLRFKQPAFASGRATVV